VSVPFYVPPEQLIKDRSDFARAGVARGRAVLVVAAQEGIVLATENPSRSLHKIAEIYDKIAFAGVGKYNEFEALRRAGVRYADLRGYAYDRVDVDARSLAGTYAATLGEAFTSSLKPLEVEVALAEVGASPDQDRLFRVGFDGSVWQDEGMTVIGGPSKDIAGRLRRNLEFQAVGSEPGAGPADSARPAGPPTLAAALAAMLRTLTVADTDDDAAPPPAAPYIECALLDRAASRRAFRRLSPAGIAALTNP
jgi:proteasome alpha subunit